MLPEAGVQFTGTEPSTMSEDEAVNVTTAPEGLVASIMMSAGKLSVGDVVSCTVTVKVVGVAALPCVSVALQVTVVLPKAKVEPEAGEQVAVPAPSTASEVDGLV